MYPPPISRTRKPGRQPNIWDGDREGAVLAGVPLGTIRASAPFGGGTSVHVPKR